MIAMDENGIGSRTLSLFVGIWNVNGNSPGEALEGWLAIDEDAPDLYAVGFQELDLSYSAFVFDESERQEEWIKAVEESLHNKANYMLVKHIRLVGMMLLVYSKVELTEFIRNVSVASVGTGIMHKLGNKGGVGIRLRIGESDFCFVNSHLAAGAEQVVRRNGDYAEICRRMRFSQYVSSDSRPGLKAISDHDCIFWFGDLNYRLDNLNCNTVKDLLAVGDVASLQEVDQLQQQRDQGKVFSEYQEGAIMFRPTYKYDPGTSRWDTSEKLRCPAWTDRILWRGERISLQGYRSHEELVGSDHKPVSALFLLGLKEINMDMKETLKGTKEDINNNQDKVETHSPPRLDIDDVFLAIGELGNQQRVYAAYLCLMCGYVAFHLFQYVFVSFAIDFTCSSGQQSWNNHCPGNSRDMCQVLKFSSAESVSTIVSEWGLVCDRNYLSDATMSAFMAGVLLGSFVLGRLADKIGRKNCITISLVGVIFFNTTSAISSYYLMYVVAKFCVGFFLSGMILATFVLGNEMVGQSKRGIFSLSWEGSKAVGLVLLSLVAYQVQHWRYITLLISMLGLPFLSYHWLLPESPRWLLCQKRKAEAVTVLEDIARGNGSVLSEIVMHDLATDEEIVLATAVQGDNEGLLDLFRHWELGLVTVIQLYSWLVNGAVYLGLTLAAGGIGGGGLYSGTALSGLVELPAFLLTYRLLGYLGRRTTLCLFMIGAGLSCFRVQLLTSTYPYVITSSALVGKFCMSASFAISYIHSGEIFPTTIRNSAMGLVAGSARAGGIVAPFIVLLDDYYPYLQFTIFGILALSSGLLNLLLPETQGRKLPDSVSQVVRELQTRREKRS